MAMKPKGGGKTLLPVPQLPQTRSSQAAAKPSSSFGSKLTGVKTDRGAFQFKANKGGFKA